MSVRAASIRVVPDRAGSQSSIDATPQGRNSIHIPRHTSWGTSIPPPSQNPPAYARSLDSLDDVFYDVKLKFKDDESTPSSTHSVVLRNVEDDVAAVGLSLGKEESQPRLPANGRLAPDLLASEQPEGNRWMKSLKKRSAHCRSSISFDAVDSEYKELFDFSKRKLGHKKSWSDSSMGFVTAVKSATISIASFSIAPRSKRTAMSHHGTEFRYSEDSSFVAKALIVDQDVTTRRLQRRCIIEEIISTEESYLADLKFLLSIYVTLLGTLPALSSKLRQSMISNLNAIIELHEAILGELYNAVPHSEYTQLETEGARSNSQHVRHNRWHSADAIPQQTAHHQLQRIPGLTAEPEVAVAVARVFETKLGGFFIYEEYGAQYETMMRDLTTSYKSAPQWDHYQRGLEALASTLASIQSQDHHPNKALTIGDLLVKPMQRVCKYPLLFAELLRQTPVCDCPDSHSKIEVTLGRLRETTTDINRATDDPQLRIILERTWLLQDRLVFDGLSDPLPKAFIRSLGRVHMCGVLHVAWQTNDGVDGQYMISLLYREFFLLASASKAEQKYNVHACINLSELRIEDVDNGKGVQCHTALYSWKIVFEVDHQLFEITMSACSAKEEQEWKRRLDASSLNVAHTSFKNEFTNRIALSSISLNIKSMGTVFGKPGTIARRISIHRAATSAQSTGLCQVIIKNTTAVKEIAHSASSASLNMNRSQSLLTTRRIPLLAPARDQRIKLENLISDVWSREILPFPGMALRARGESVVRASASSIMRKLSVASIASNFSKRSGSIASLHKAVDTDVSEPDIPRRVSSRGDNSCDHTSSDQVELPRPRLAMIADEKENLSQESLLTCTSAHFCNSADTRRLGTLKEQKISGSNSPRLVSPPLRATSANSVKTAPMSTLAAPTVLLEPEFGASLTRMDRMASQASASPKSIHTPKNLKARWSKKTAVSGGFRSLFR